jgi:transposase
VSVVPKPCAREFRDDVVRVARNRDAGVRLELSPTISGSSDDAVEVAAHAADVQDGGNAFD